MRVLSLFDGISCGQQALDRLGIKPEKYYSSEVDKYAISITQKNYPDTIQLGDVTKWREWDIDWASIDLLIGGSPCQGFSMAGKQLAFDDPRSALFFVFVDIRNHIQKFNPDVQFLLENVRMKKDHLAVITEYMGVEPVMINSALVSAQNRVRFYWANWEITQPEDRGVLLKDILETGVNADRDKSYCIDANYYKGGESKVKVLKLAGYADIKGHDSIKRVYSDEGKAPTLTTMGGGNTEPKVALQELTWRKLSCLECERLQTVEDNYTAQGVNDKDEVVPISNTQRYKTLGNGWTVEVIKHILGGIGDE